MQFQESTQLRNWLISADQLRRQREENRQRSLEALQQARARSTSVASLDTLNSETSGGAATEPAAAAAAAGAGSESPAPQPPSLEEELLLLKYYGGKLQHVCRELRLPRRVLGTALTYLKRIYLSHCCLDHDPQQLLLTCLYLSCKIEEHYISAAELGRLTGVPAEVILRTELTALQGLKFDLIVYSPYKAIEGLFEDIKEMAAAAADAAGPGGSEEAVAAAAAAAGLDPGMAALSEEQLGKAKAVAYSAADALMLSDAPLLHTPGRLALAAVRSGLNKVGIKLQKYVERVAQRATTSAAGGGDGGGSSSGSGSATLQQQLEQLQAALAELDQLGAEGARTVEQAQIAGIDRKLKACRSQLMEGSNQAASKAKAKADKAARKAARAAEQRSAAEAAVGILPAPPGSSGSGGTAEEQPPAKRARQGE